MKYVSDKSFIENRNTHFLFNNLKTSAVCELLRNSTAERSRPQTTIWRKRIACWIPKATNTHSYYVTLFAVEWQQWLHEHASMLRYMYTVCLVYINFRIWNDIVIHGLYPVISRHPTHRRTKWTGDREAQTWWIKRNHCFFQNRKAKFHSRTGREGLEGE